MPAPPSSSNSPDRFRPRWAFPAPRPSAGLERLGGGRGGTAGLLEAHAARAGLPKGSQPLADRVGIALQRLPHPRFRPAPTQQPQRVPPLPLARGRRAIHSLAEPALIQLPTREERPNVVHLPFSFAVDFLFSLSYRLCGFHRGFTLGTWLDPQTQRRLRLCAFLLILAHCRHLFLRVVARLDQQSWLECHVAAFSFL